MFSKEEIMDEKYDNNLDKLLIKKDLSYFNRGFFSKRLLITITEEDVDISEIDELEIEKEVFPTKSFNFQILTKR